MQQSIISNIETIQNRMKTACENCGRNIDSVQLLLATKIVSAEKIKLALNNGQTLIAENKIQEINAKFQTLKDVPHRAHFIGHLQTNKLKNLFKYNVEGLQSLDRLRLAEKLQSRLEFEDKTMNVFLQFNTSYETSKFGMNPENALKFIQDIKRLDRFQIKGLMTIGLLSAHHEEVRKGFRLLKKTQLDLLDKGYSVEELSMGMSGDFEVAIEEGATIVRIRNGYIWQTTFSW